jgi:hypothetical protein
VFQNSYDKQFSIWKKFRNKIDKSEQPLEDTIKFWAMAPLVNKHLDVYRIDTWPDPWQIIKDGKYNDFTINLMIGHTLKLSERFNESQIEIRTYLDMDSKIVYNTCYIDNKVLNYPYGEVTSEEDIPNNIVLQMAVPLPDYK